MGNWLSNQAEAENVKSVIKAVPSDGTTWKSPGRGGLFVLSTMDVDCVPQLRLNLRVASPGSVFARIDKYNLVTYVDEKKVTSEDIGVRLMSAKDISGSSTAHAATQEDTVVVTEPSSVILRLTLAPDGPMLRMLKETSLVTGIVGTMEISKVAVFERVPEVTVKLMRAVVFT